MWDERFAGPGYYYGTDPAEFVERWGSLIPAGSRVLCLADGEGRNSVFLARLGHRVTAMDGSAVAIAKARALDARAGVTVERVQADLFAWDWAPEAYDAVVSVSLQFAPPPMRDLLHRGVAQTPVPGGLAMFHGFARRQPAYNTGGPRAVENLYDLPLLLGDFAGWQVPHAADEDRLLREGTGHRGLAALVDFIAVKPRAGA
ncbi:MAG: class I SAM-dependent methyltransferase [Rhodobacterales bacterium]|nr:class I SAM-dependent methyltransferase [Rhodobacterales bacterium]